MMKHSLASLLGEDHESLGQLLAELETELAKANIARAFELLDLFWARLAVHIRAENLHLFPAIANAPASLFTGSGRLPTSEDARSLLGRLSSDHNFFMKELALMMKAMREITADELARLEETDDLRERLTSIAKRLEAHNLLEEKQAYIWPELLFDEKTVAALSDHIRQELDNLPPRFG